MRYLIFGDTHGRSFEPPSDFFAIFLGDAVDEKMRMEDIESYLEFFDELRKKARGYVGILGNHDREVIKKYREYELSFKVEGLGTKETIVENGEVVFLLRGCKRAPAEKFKIALSHHNSYSISHSKVDMYFHGHLHRENGSQRITFGIFEWKKKGKRFSTKKRKMWEFDLKSCEYSPIEVMETPALVYHIFPGGKMKIELLPGIYGSYMVMDLGTLELEYRGRKGECVELSLEEFYEDLLVRFRC